MGDTQSLGISSLLNGQSTPVSFLVGIGSRQTFTLSVDLYTVLQGSALMAADIESPEGNADTAVFGPAVLLGHYEFVSSETAVSPSPGGSDFTPDPLSNMPIVTGPGPQSGPAVAVDPVIPSHMAIASNDYLIRAVRVSTTQDGGMTWHDTTLGTTLGNQTFFTAQNPALAFDSRGKLSVVYTLSNLCDSAKAL